MPDGVFGPDGDGVTIPAFHGTMLFMIIEEHIMTNIEPRPLPQSTVQLVGQTSDALIGGMSRTPLMLGVLLLNIIGIGCAVYFLSILINGQQQHLKSLLEVQQLQMDKVLQAHQREFDALIEMSNRLSSYPTIQSPIAPASQSLNQPPSRERR